MQWVDIDLIRPNPYQPRKQFPERRSRSWPRRFARAGSFSRSFCGGPIQGTESSPVSVDGVQHSARAAEGPRPSCARSPRTDLLELALIENIQRQNLNAIEEARAYQSLIEDFGLSQVEVAEKVGRQRSTIANALRLLELRRACRT
jgi:ParB family chromosome partitioning protein